MILKDKLISVQVLEQVHGELNGELSPALEILNGKLRHGFKHPQAREGEASREYAELREARSIVFSLKHPDRADAAPVSLSELAWALKLAKETCQAEGHQAALSLFDKAAGLLGIDPAHSHDVPDELRRKINNELKLLGFKIEEDPPAALKLAVAA